ncbi:FUSC family protein [Streptomyces sp. NPDC058374]|uniref:FUSC family protein n=1 Tax=Streptomyces sp. NPDC058374 TaxID=3346466 RepID=UPI00364D584F
MVGQPVAGVAVGLGGLWAVGQDSAAPYKARALRIAALGGSAAVGLLAGATALRHGDIAVIAALLAAAGLVSGWVSVGGPLASVAGMHLLLGATVGTGIPVPGPWWAGPLELLGGALFALALTCLPWLWRRNSPEREAVIAVFDAAEQALSRAGTSGATEARARMTLALNTAQDLLAVHSSRKHAERPTHIGGLIVAFRAAVHLVEAATALVVEGRPLPPAVVRVPSLLAARVVPPVRGGRPAPAEAAEELEPPFTADTPALRALAEVYRAPGHALTLLPDPPAYEGPRLAERLRFALLLGGCTLVAVVVAHLLHGPRGYWLPMTVAFLYKPDLGPVFGRALNRCLGTVAGVGMVALVAWLVTEQWALTLVAAAFGAVMAAGVRYHYALSTFGLTVIVFVFIDFLGDDRQLLPSRVLETVIAAALVLTAHFLTRPDSWRVRAELRVAAADRAWRRYDRRAPTASPDERHQLRRTAYRRLAEARQALDTAGAEPHRDPDRFPVLERRVARAEQGCDAITAYVVAGGRS